MARNGSSVIQAMLKKLAEEESKERMERQRVKGSAETVEPARALTARQ
jgi:hypothetical protein